MISGELEPILEKVDFTSKTELLNKLRDMRKSAGKLTKDDRHVVKQMLGVALSQVYYTSENELLRFKKFLDYKKNKRKENA